MAELPSSAEQAATTDQPSILQVDNCARSTQHHQRRLERFWRIPEHQIPKANERWPLCHTCRSINFHYLILRSPITILGEHIPLGLVSDILARQDCTFCRLVYYALKGATEGGNIPFQYEDKSIEVTLTPSTKENSILEDPKQLLIVTNPDIFRKTGRQPLAIQHVTIVGILGPVEPGEGLLVSSKNADLALIKFWLQRCQRGLAGCPATVTHRETVPFPPNFRLIDTHRQCIISGNSGFQYATLSYVWGQKDQFGLFISDKYNLKQDQSLTKHASMIPRTVKDAMLLVAALGERYLWVDTLCIVQDDRDDKASQIAAMSTIYNLSLFTIAAAFGENSDAGIPGIRAGTRKWQNHDAYVQGLRLACRPPRFQDSVNGSKWNSRMWTYQERVMSQRVLFFTEQQMFFKCEHSPTISSEDLGVYVKRRFPHYYPMNDLGTDTIPIKWSTNILTYWFAIERFTSRNITYNSDVLNAFDAIAQRLRESFRSKLLFGLPQSELCECLLWKPSCAGLVRRTDQKTLAPLFPSWSWAGWIGPVHYHTHQNVSRIQWVADDGRRLTSADLREPELENLRNVWLDDWEQQHEKGTVRWFEKSAPDIWYHHPIAREARIAGPMLQPETNFLRFSTETVDVKFPMDWKPPIQENQLVRLRLGDTLGGYVDVPSQQFAGIDPSKYQYDLVALSRTKRADPAEYGSNKDYKTKPSPERVLPEGCTIDNDRTAEKLFFPDEPPPDFGNDELDWLDRRHFDVNKPYNSYNILFVEWREGVAFRLGIGLYHIDSWAQAEPVRKVVILG
ncbi:MAG: hypothetical protein M1813_002741 [Trichoglossum hirsutum]|nr:MAG: hypothetical protein M1813_002741 [Trichoglossum hirsutum]